MDPRNRSSPHSSLPPRRPEVPHSSLPPSRPEVRRRIFAAILGRNHTSGQPKKKPLNEDNFLHPDNQYDASSSHGTLHDQPRKKPLNEDNILHPDNQYDSSSSHGTLHDLSSEEEKEMFEKIKQKFSTLNRIKDYLLLMLSSPMHISNRADCENRAQDISKIFSHLRKLEAGLIGKNMDKRDEFCLRDMVKNDFTVLSTDIAELLDDPFMDEIEAYIPRNMVEKIYKPLLPDLQLEAAVPGKKFEAPPSTSSARVEEIDTVEQKIPAEILQSAVRFAVSQISGYIRSKKFQNIRVYGRGERKVLLSLKNNLPEEYSDSILSVNLSNNQSHSEVRADIARQMYLTITDKFELQHVLCNVLQNRNFVLLLDGIDERIVREVGIPLNPGRGALVFTTGSHEIPPKMQVDVEINMEDHLLAWKLFCEILGEFVHSSTVENLAISIFEKCRGHMLVISLMANYLKNATDVEIWEDALHKLTSLPYEIKGINRIVANAVVLNWEGMEIVSKHCIKYCASHPKGTWFNKVSLVSNWIKNGIIHTPDEGKYILEGLTCTFLLEDLGKGKSVLLQEEARDIFLRELTHKMHSLILKRGMPKDEELDSKAEERDTDTDGEEWNASDEEWDFREIHLMDNNLSELPDSPNCPVLLRLFLQRNYDLTNIPSSFFEHMPVLQVLDLSYTSIKNLPHSLSRLVALRKFFLRGCELFMDLPPQVGELKNLEELDLDKTEILHLPTEIGNLEKMKVLKVSFYACMNGSKKSVQLNQNIPPGVISKLSQLAELSIDFNPDDDEWDLTREFTISEVRSLKSLKTLKLNILEAKFLGSLLNKNLSHFRFVVGRRKQCIIVKVPHEVEAEFDKWDKCLKFVYGENISNEIRDVLKYATAFFLDRHMTVTNLSEFGIENVKKLKFCILAECNQLQNIGDGEKFYGEGDNAIDVEEEEDNDTYESDADIEEEYAFESLRYLNIYYMRDLVSIWKGPIRRLCLSRLKFLELHTCPQLSTIFTPDLLRNLINLEELVIEDCPQVINLLVSDASFKSASDDCFLPTLKRMSLLFLPELVSISCSSVYIAQFAPKLERIGFYNCPKLISLSTKDLSSKNLTVIKGEKSWWEALQWDEWGGRPEHLDGKFSSIINEEDLMTQLENDGIYLNIQNKNESLLNGQV